MALYVSDYTKFMRGLLEQHPEWAEDQLVGRSLFWDKKIDLSEQQKLRESKEANRPYPYDVNFEKR
jgi:hypothetical protein